MKVSKVLISAALLFAAQSGFAKTPAELSSAIKAIIPAGTKAKLAWTQGGTLPDKPGTNTIYVVDSDDGNVRRLLTQSVDADWPNITADGSKVFFFDMASKKVIIIDWNGQNYKELAVPAPDDETTLEHWVDPVTKIDWAILGLQSCGRIARFRLDDVTKCVAVWNGSGTITPSYGDGLGMSADGTRFCAMMALGSDYASGIGPVPSGTISRAPKWIGCGISIIPDNSYTAAIGDTCVKIVDGAGNVKVKYYVEKVVADYASSKNTINTECNTYPEFLNFRWSNHLDYLAFTSAETKANPYIYNVKTSKFVGIVDDMGCKMTGHADLKIIAATGIAPNTYSVKNNIAHSTASQSLYTIDGKLISKNGLSAQKRITNVVCVKQGLSSELKAVLTAK